MKRIEIGRMEYGGWPNCYRLANGEWELIVTADVGPRVIRCGFLAGENEFKEYPDQVGQMGGSDWRIYGGHRLWHAPEHELRTYVPDNSPVKVELRDRGARFVQEIESVTGIQKEMELAITSDSAQATVIHRLRNAGSLPVTLAPWALTVLAPGGVAILPLPPRGSHPKDLLPGNSLTLWKYTDMSDPRWTWGRQYILLRQDSSSIAKPQKIGAAVPNGWAAFARAGRLFLKTFRHDPAATYPDRGCSVEVFTNKEMLELETLGPLTTLSPGEVVEHIEHWSLFRDVPIPRSDADMDAGILPLVQAITGHSTVSP